MIPPQEVLRQAATLICQNRSWIRGHFAVDEQGLAVKPWDERACAWCAMGAIAKVCHDSGSPDGIQRRVLLAMAREYDPGMSDRKVSDIPLLVDGAVIHFNDDAESAEQVAALMEKAADDLEKGGKA